MRSSSGRGQKGSHRLQGCTPAPPLRTGAASGALLRRGRDTTRKDQRGRRKHAWNRSVDSSQSEVTAHAQQCRASAPTLSRVPPPPPAPGAATLRAGRHTLGCTPWRAPGTRAHGGWADGVGGGLVVGWQGARAAHRTSPSWPTADRKMRTHLTRSWLRLPRRESGEEKAILWRHTWLRDAPGRAKRVLPFASRPATSLAGASTTESVRTCAPQGPRAARAGLG